MHMENKLDPDDAPTWISDILCYEDEKNIICSPNQDDCGIINIGNTCIIATTDYLNASPIATELDIGGYEDLGRLVVDNNLADLCGTGADPEALLLAFTLSRPTEKGVLEQLILGAKAEADNYGVPIIGGDTKLGESDALLGVAIGSATNQSSLFLKRGAIPGDDIWLSGPTGSVCAALLGLINDIGNTEWRAWAENAIVHPSLPIEASRRVCDSGLANGGMDISDGLGDDLIELCETSDVGAIVDVNNIPVEDNARKIAEELGYPPWALSFVLGGDLQFVCTIPETANSRRTLRDIGLYRIGRITSSREEIMLNNNGYNWPIPHTGHRDSRNMSFADEITFLLDEVSSPSNKS